MHEACPFKKGDILLLQMILITAAAALTFLPLQRTWWQRTDFRRLLAPRYILGLFYGAFLFYAGLADQSVTLLIAAYVPVVAVWLIIDNVVVYMTVRTFRKKEASAGAGIGILLLVASMAFFIFQPLFLADAKYDIAGGEEVTSDDLPPVNEESIPVVPRSYAEYRADIMMGQLENPAFFTLGSTRIQRVDDALYWITPIEYDDFFRWVRADNVPGFIMVSAENPREDPQLIETDMQYVPSAFFHENLERHVRMAYPDVVMLDTTFEVDTDGNPYYIVSYGHYTQFRRVADVDGIITVDPADGSMENYEAEDAPEWVNRVYPPHIAEERNEWFGMYSRGLINRYFGREGLTQPTTWSADDTVTGIVDDDLQLNWFTDHMRLTDEGEEGSRSMVGFTMFDARTGDLRYFRDASGMLNGRTAMDLAERTFRRDDYVAGTPSLYPIYGQYTWVVPLMDRNAVLREVMLVHAGDENVYGYGSTKREAFNAYQLELSTTVDDDVVPGELTDMVEEEKTIGRVYHWDREENVTVRIWFEGEDRIFTLNASSHPTAVFLEPGDDITIRYMDSGEAVQPIEEMDFDLIPVEDEEADFLEDIELDEEDPDNDQ